ncbi:MAG TPA: hypothetical protein VFT90_14525, partial [Chryseosolibacter sp.]|nr:hypothetical protein [Chryseosolibacter sp.]
PNCKECLLAFSRVLFDDELLVAYNISGSETKTEFVQVDANGDDLFEVVFGSEGIIPVERVNDSFSYVKLELSPLQFVVLVRSHQEAIHSNPAVL